MKQGAGGREQGAGGREEKVYLSLLIPCAMRSALCQL